MVTQNTTNITNIPAPRVPFVDARTGLVSHEWYRFLLNLFTLTGGGQSDMTIRDILIGPSAENSQAQIAELQKQIEILESINIQQSAYLTEVHKQIEDLNLLPPILNDDRTKLDKLIVKAGSATAPSITTEGDEDTGVYFPAANKITITTDGVERLRVGSTGNIAIATGKKFYLDNVTEAGDTYLIESAANTVDLYVGGIKALKIMMTGTEIAGHPKLEGVTATGATGTGKLVFDSAPTLSAPNLGTPSVLVGTNITGTAASLSVGYATSAGSAPTSGFSGTVAPVASITVLNGLVTAIA